MKKYIAWILIFTVLLLAGCKPVDPVSTDPSGPALQNTTPTATQPTEPNPTDVPTEPKPTEPKPEVPEGFPDDIDTNPTTVALFQELFGNDTWYAQALYIPFDEPQNADISALFNGGFSDESPVTDEERNEIVKMMNSELYYDLDMFRLPVDKMNAVLRTVFGLSLDDMNKVGLKFLASTDCYYLVGGGSKSLGEIHIVGTKMLDTGNIELYYEATYPAYKGVVTLKLVEGGYHILSNYYSEDGTWPKPTDPTHTEPQPTEPQPTEPTIPLDSDGFPVDLKKDADVLRELQSLFSCIHPSQNYFNTALCSQYEDPRYANLAALFLGGIEEEKYTPTEDEIAQLVSQFGWDPELDIYRLPTEGMDGIVTQVFGISLSDMDKSAFEYLLYLESSDTYFNTYNLTLCAHEFKAVGYYLLDSGNIELYYQATYPAYKGVVTLKPVEDGYHILSNRWFE